MINTEHYFMKNSSVLWFWIRQYFQQQRPKKPDQKFDSEPSPVVSLRIHSKDLSVNWTFSVRIYDCDTPPNSWIRRLHHPGGAHATPPYSITIFPLSSFPSSYSTFALSLPNFIRLHFIFPPPRATLSLVPSSSRVPLLPHLNPRHRMSSPLSPVAGSLPLDFSFLSFPRLFSRSSTTLSVNPRRG